jgi:hypothetical protein
MALKIMLSNGKKICHDLESIFYVLIWVCSHMEGPETERSDPHSLESLPVREWCSMNVDLRTLGLIKLSHLAYFEDSILRHFTPYWNDFKPYLRQLKSAFWPTSTMFPNPNNMTSEKMLAILREAIANVKDVEVQYTLVSQSYSILNTKPYRQGQDVVAVSKRMKTAPGVSAVSKSSMIVQDFGIWKESVILEPVRDCGGTWDVECS